MAPRIRYLEWASQAMPSARFDLASSGVPFVKPEALGSIAGMSEWVSLRTLAERLAARYAVSEDEVVPTLGASGALWVLVSSLLRPGDEVLVEEPAYEPIFRVVEAVGARVTRFARSAERRYAIETGAVLSAVGPRTRLVMITNPHNPSGAHVGDDEMRELATALDARGVELLIDEVYRELCEPAATAHRLGPRVTTVSSLTKCFGLGWARVGWALARPEVAEAARIATMHMVGILPATVGAIGVAALADADRRLAKLRALNEAKRGRVDAFLAASGGRLRWVPPPTALHFGFVSDMRGGDLAPVIERGLVEEGVLVVPGVYFGQPSGFRMSWTSAEGVLDEGLRRLGRVLEL